MGQQENVEVGGKQKTRVFYLFQSSKSFMYISFYVKSVCFGCFLDSAWKAKQKQQKTQEMAIHSTKDHR